MSPIVCFGGWKQKSNKVKETIITSKIEYHKHLKKIFCQLSVTDASIVADELDKTNLKFLLDVKAKNLATITIETSSKNHAKKIIKGINNLLNSDVLVNPILK